MRRLENSRTSSAPRPLNWSTLIAITSALVLVAICVAVFFNMSLNIVLIFVAITINTVAVTSSVLSLHHSIDK